MIVRYYHWRWFENIGKVDQTTWHYIYTKQITPQAQASLFAHETTLQIIPYTHQKVLEYYNPALPISPEGFGHFLFRFSDMTSTAVAGL
jgi:hypothetical protein